MEKTEYLKLVIITPDKRIEENAEGLMIQQPDGFRGFLPDHIGYITKIVGGILTYYRNKEEFFIATSAGYFKFENNQAMLIVDSAERGDTLNILSFKKNIYIQEADAFAQRAHHAFEAARIALWRTLQEKKEGIHI